MESPLIKIDDKHVPLYRLVYIADVPHFCGDPDCMHEGEYEVRLDVDDIAIWVGQNERDHAIRLLEQWCSEPPPRAAGDEDPWET